MKKTKLLTVTLNSYVALEGDHRMSLSSEQFTLELDEAMLYITSLQTGSTYVIPASNVSICAVTKGKN